jgi:hypothetical protein
MLYAHAVIVDPRTDFRYERGQEVPDDLPGLDELQQFGSVKDEPYVAPRDGDDAIVLSEAQVQHLSPGAQHELQELGLTVRHNGADGGTSAEAHA